MSENLVTLFTQVAEKDLPQPGSWVQVQMSNGMVAQLWNLREGRDLNESASHSLHYVPVRTASVKQHVIHAAINRRLDGRNKTAETTICSRMGDDRRIVSSIVAGNLDDTVTCAQCRTQLFKDGVIQAA